MKIVLKYTIRSLGVRPMWIVLAALCGLCFAIPSHAQQFSTYREMRRAVLDVRPDSTQIFDVQGIVIEDGPLTVSLDSGTIVFSTPVGKRRLFASFVGKGIVSFTPNIAVERRQLKRFYPNDVYNEECTEVFFVCTDSLVLEQVRDLPHAAQVFPKGTHARFAEGLQSVLHGSDSLIDQQYATALLNDTPVRSFALQAKGSGEYGCIVINDGFDSEPYTFILNARKSGSNFYKPVCQCPPMSGIVEADDRGVIPGELAYIAQHTMAVRFESNLSMAVNDRMDLKVESNGTRWISFDLMPQFTVDSVRLYKADKLLIENPEKAGEFWVQLPSTMKKGDSISIEVFYHGRIVERNGDYTFLAGSIQWYPHHGWSQLGYFDLEFNYENRYVLTSVGANVSKQVKDDRVVSRWVVGTPQRNASFNIGVFRERDVKEPGIPDVSIFHTSISHEEDVELDVKQSLTFYTKLYGPLKIQHLYATELPGYHGEAFPGMLHLSHEAFENFGDDFFAEQFIAHEVGHQWWGIGVDLKTYRDRWISEAFAEYSALMYSQIASEDKDKFFRLMDDMSEKICTRGNNTIGKAQEPPMISLGHRVSWGGKGGDYNNFVYYKGAWVVHMLRNLMLNLQTMREDDFMTVMSSFFKTYQGKHASTTDFRKHLEKLSGKDMRWFFDQWVDGNQIPTYRVAWKKTKQSDGTWLVTMRVKQENVDSTFYMPVPIKITFDNNTITRKRVNMTGAQAEITLPPFKDEPDDLVFNDLHSVLCIVKTESF